MKHEFFPAARTAPLVKALAAAGLACLPAASIAALTDLAQSPLASSSTSIVKPNLNFVLDHSGSMAWSHAPDESEPFFAGYGYKAKQCNSIYYDPTITYTPPKKSDGTSYPAAAFTAAWVDGFNSGSTLVNLQTSFYAYDNTTSSGNGSDTPTNAYYYKYTGSQTFNYTNTSSTFYKECNSNIGSAPGSSVFTKVLVTPTSGPGGTNERVNFSNWFSYYRTRILLMKSAAGRAFVTIGDTYRVGFTTIYSNYSDSNFLAIADFAQPQKDAWFATLYSKYPSGSTPLKQALARAGLNFAGRIGTDPVQYSCQQNFTILTTDGYWNSGTTSGVKLDGSTSVGNQDNNAANTPRPMYEGATAASNTLADVAAYYYNNDLRNDTGPDAVANCNTGVAGADVCKDNVPVSGLDDAPWQHMTTFTVGLGVNGQLNYNSAYLTGGSTDYNAIKSGSKDWPVPKGDTLTTVDDLWHAAVNGHGQYFSAKDPDAMVTGLRQALAGISARKAAGAAAATSNLEPISGDNFAYVANYRTQKWDGDLQQRNIDLVTGAISTTANWSAQTQLDLATASASDSRVIFTFLGGAKKDFVPASFTSAQLSAWFDPVGGTALSQVAGWNPVQTAAALPATLVNWLRGQFQFDERTANTVRLYRQRDHILGDIINGKPIYVKVPPFNYVENSYQTFKTSLSSRTPMVYVAGNDGMLHAFDSATGNEKWAYVPSFVLPSMKVLADTDYANKHIYLADGSPTVSDIWNGSAWKTILVAGLNGGGKGYYALDITDPANPQVMWEYTDVNMGFSYGNPVIGKLTDGSWVVGVTSGYNNADGNGHLFVINAVTGLLKYDIATGAGSAATPSGLGRISAWVDDGLNDNTIQRIYGGDTLGNLWRFDVNDTIGTSGRDAMQIALFKSGGVLQPVTTKPELGLVSGFPVIFVGTGKYLGASDATDTSQQSFYAIKDSLSATGIGDAHAAGCMVKQTLLIATVNLRSMSNNAVDFATNCGWYIDLNPGNQTPGERVNVDPKLQLGVLGFVTNIPEKSVCTVGGSSFLYFLDFAKGSFVPTAPSTSAGPKAGERIGNSIAVGLNTYRLPDGRVVSTITTSDDSHPVYDNPDNPTVGSNGKRVLWRELLQ